MARFFVVNMRNVSEYSIIRAKRIKRQCTSSSIFYALSMIFLEIYIIKNVIEVN
jgi:hypothetical protein